MGFADPAQARDRLCPWGDAAEAVAAAVGLWGGSQRKPFGQAPDPAPDPSYGTRTWHKLLVLVGDVRPPKLHSLRGFSLDPAEKLLILVWDTGGGEGWEPALPAPGALGTHGKALAH